MHELGTVLNGRYRVEAILGQGGMGNVYLARYLAQDEMVAIKEMIPTKTRVKLREAAMRQFRAEALILHSLEHPRLPQVLDFFEVEGNPFLVMEYIKGRSLQKVVESEDDPLPERLVRRWAFELCEVLEYLHTHDPVVVFRDLKPGNIILDAEENIKLIDFGISKIFDVKGKSNTNTFARHCVSPGYTAPEQYAGRSEPRSDIYSLGATLYFVLTGKTPADAVSRLADVGSLASIRALRPDVSEAFAEGIHALLVLPTSQRVATIAEVRDLLHLDPERFVGSLPTMVSDWSPSPHTPEKRKKSFLSTPPPGPAPPPRPPRRPAVVLAAVLLSVGVAGAAWMALHAQVSAWAPAASLQITTFPDGAKVYLDRQIVGTTPVSLPSVLPGSYAIELYHDGYASVQEHLVIGNAEHRTLDLKLVPQTISVGVMLEPPDAVVEEQGAPLTVTNGAVQLTRGLHVVNVSRSGFEAQAVAVDVGPELPPAPIIASLLSAPTASPGALATASAMASLTPLTSQSASPGIASPASASPDDTPTVTVTLAVRPPLLPPDSPVPSLEPAVCPSSSREAGHPPETSRSQTPDNGATSGGFTASSSVSTTPSLSAGVSIRPSPVPSASAAPGTLVPLLDDTRIVVGERAGPFALNTAMEAFLGRWGSRPYQHYDLIGGRRLYSFVDGSVWVEAPRGTIDSIFVRNPAWQTDTGLGPSASDSLVQERYGPGTLESLDGRDWSVYPAQGLAVEYRAQHVAWLLLGPVGKDLPRSFTAAAGLAPPGVLDPDH